MKEVIVVPRPIISPSFSGNKALQNQFVKHHVLILHITCLIIWSPTCRVW